MQFNYNSSVPQGGFGADVPNQIQGLRTSAPPSILQSAFNSPVYQKNRLQPQQAAGMQRNMNDQYRAGAWRQANELSRAYQPANQQLQMQQMQGAVNAGNTLNDIFTQGMLGERQNEMNWQQGAPQAIQQGMSFLGPLFNMFGG